MAITTEIRLKPEIIQLIRSNQKVKNQLQLTLDISHTTLYRYLDLNSDQLTLAVSLKIIGDGLGIDRGDLLNE